MAINLHIAKVHVAWKQWHWNHNLYFKPQFSFMKYETFIHLTFGAVSHYSEIKETADKLHLCPSELDWWNKAAFGSAQADKPSSVSNHMYCMYQPDGFCSYNYSLWWQFLTLLLSSF